ncbi:O-antigen ligase family protein [Clostridium thermobutyricum]|uniref:O-antigen ligase-related domain-containing protein n=1 Tax=Clostridium thermobutyricum DSM 4928 TaxID=1121339 RepID=A0A1V4T0K7_9CLOT|nr:O-antigen ligase family protein [Clostridium thermobutyricum]OPX50374.1 hypothetical protein CLTHE_02310 [Clostridium thermobutyricum DSM 4928]
MYIKEKVISILEYLLAFCIIVNANTVWNFSYCSQYLWIYTIIILYLIIILSVKHIKKNKGRLFILGILLIIISSYNAIFIMINGRSKGTFIIDFMAILLGFVIYSLICINKEDRYRLLLKISNIVVILAIISLVFYFGGTIFKYFKPTEYIPYHWGFTRKIPSYHNIYYETQDVLIGGKVFTRNTGIFTEAPMYGFSLSIALITELFIRKIKGFKNLIIFFISMPILIFTILTTLSTTAIGVMSVAIPIRILISIINNLKKSKKIVLVNIILLIIVAFIGLKVGGYFLHNKIQNSAHNKYGSFAVRKDDFKVGYKVWKENKIWGVGFDQYQYVQQQMNFIGRGSNIGGSSALMKVMPEGGIVLLILYIIPFVLAMLYGIKKKDLCVISIFIFVYILFAVTEIQYRYMMIYFLALGYSYILTIKKDKCLKENNK